MFRTLGLRARLVLSHLSVVLVGLGVGMTLHRWLIHQYFGSALGGAIAAMLMSVWATQRITQPFLQMQQITQDFAAGQLESRLPKSAIPEINQLNRSFNRMALRLKEVESTRSELIGDLAHELRTPLTIVRGYLEEWADERIRPTVQSFHQLIREVRRLERLVMDLQVLSKAETGHLPLQLQRVKISDLFQNIETIFASQISDTGPQLTIESPYDVIIWADPDRTQQILINLVGNALRYTQQGYIRVQAKSTPEQVWITVTDSGAGISETDIPHVFDRFWRSSRSRMTHPDGSGLGLAIAKRFIELQGGQIEVTSQLGHGTTFSLSLPAFQP